MFRLQDTYFPLPIWLPGYGNTISIIGMSINYFTTPICQSQLLHAVPDLVHGFYGRGAVTTANSGISAVTTRDWGDASLAAAAFAFPQRGCVRVNQEHGNAVWSIARPSQLVARSTWPRADAIACSMPGILLLINSADCGVILLVDPKARVIAACHAGWRGACAGITSTTITAMLRLGAKREHILAAVGPMIAQASFQVGEDVKTAFAICNDLLPQALRDQHMQYFRPDATLSQHWRFDLGQWLIDALLLAGIAQVERLHFDTYCDQRFFSARKIAHSNGNSKPARQLDFHAITMPMRQPSVIGYPPQKQN